MNPIPGQRPESDPTEGPEVTVDDLTEAGVDEPDRWAELATTTLVGEGIEVGTLDLLFVDPPAMAELNRQHMGHDGPTDVLAFPLDADELRRAPAVVGDDDGPPLHLGDIVICPRVATEQAPDHCGTVEAELSLLVIHGVLHVLGHDHREEGERLAMQARERHHMSGAGHHHPVPVPAGPPEPASTVGDRP